VHQLRARIKSIWASIQVGITVTVCVAGAIFVLAMLARIFAPLAPFVTLVFAIVVTIGGLGHTRETGIMSLGGITLYALSWPAYWQYGYVGVLLTAIGISLWFYAGLRGAITPIPSPARCRA